MGQVIMEMLSLNDADPRSWCIACSQVIQLANSVTIYVVHKCNTCLTKQTLWNDVIVACFRWVLR